MATQNRGLGRIRAFVGRVVRLVLVAGFTGIETLALGVWLLFVRGAPSASRSVVVGLAVLFVGLLFEHFLTDIAVNGLDVSVPGTQVVAFTATETTLWALWLVVAESVGGLAGVLVAGAVLATSLIPQHTVEDNVLRSEGIRSDLVDLDTLGFSLIEAAGATVWLALVVESDAVESVLADAGITGVDPASVGLAVLAVALFAEHVVGVGFSRRS